jgi:hypothetical protein
MQNLVAHGRAGARYLLLLDPVFGLCTTAGREYFLRTRRLPQVIRADKGRARAGVSHGASSSNPTTDMGQKRIATNESDTLLETKRRRTRGRAVDKFDAEWLEPDATNHGLASM